MMHICYQLIHEIQLIKWLPFDARGFLSFGSTASTISGLTYMLGSTTLSSKGPLLPNSISSSVLTLTFVVKPKIYHCNVCSSYIMLHMHSVK